ncbi:MAG: chloride channel protein, partial [Bacteroidetes bacterium]|nr:chloride channel protein [Bacteroidota bacterium]
MSKIRLKSLYISFLRFRRGFQNYPFRKFNYAEIALFWTKNRLTRSQFLVLSGVLVGLTAGIAAVILKMLVHTISEFVNNDIPFEERIFIYAIFPMLGIIITALIVRYFFKADDDKELSYVLRQIAKNDSKIKS